MVGAFNVCFGPPVLLTHWSTGPGALLAAPDRAKADVGVGVSVPIVVC